MSSFPYVPTSNIFNTANYNILNEGLTRDTADKLYLSLGGGVISGNLNILGTLSLNGVTANLSLISGVTAGVPAASKVLSLNASSQIAGNLTLTGTIDASTYYQSGSPISFSALSGVTAGTVTASKALIVDANKDIGELRNLYCLKVGTNTTSNLDIVSGGSTYIRLNYATSNTSFYGSILCSGAIVSTIDGSNAFVLNRTDSLSTFAISNFTTGTRLGTTNGSDLRFQTSGLDRMYISSGGAVRVGNIPTSGSKIFNVLTSTNDSAIRIGAAESSNNSYTIQYNYVSSGSGSNNLAFDPYGNSNQFVLYSDNSCQFTGYVLFSGSASISLGTGGTGIYGYNISSNSWSNYGLGPQSFNLSANFSSSIRASNVLSSSDKRLKTDIKDFDMDVDKYCEFRPVSFKWKHNLHQTKIGLIAQDVLKISSELLFPSENDEMNIEDKTCDLDKKQWNLDYLQLTCMNMNMIQKLIKSNKILENKVMELEKKNIEILKTISELKKFKIL